MIWEKADRVRIWQKTDQRDCDEQWIDAGVANEKDHEQPLWSVVDNLHVAFMESGVLIRYTYDDNVITRVMPTHKFELLTVVHPLPQEVGSTS